MILLFRGVVHNTNSCPTSSQTRLFLTFWDIFHNVTLNGVVGPLFGERCQSDLVRTQAQDFCGFPPIGSPASRTFQAKRPLVRPLQTATEHDRLV